MAQKRKPEDEMENQKSKVAKTDGTPTKPSSIRTQHLRECLMQFLYRDVLSIIISYDLFIEFNIIKSWGTKGSSDDDGKMNCPEGMCLYNDELVIADTQNHRVQIFHSDTGRFLRKMDFAANCFPTGVALDGNVICVTDNIRRELTIFTCSDFKRLALCDTADDGTDLGYYLGDINGVVIRNGEIFVADRSPPRIVVYNIEGKLLRCMYGIPRNRSTIGTKRKTLSVQEQMYHLLEAGFKADDIPDDWREANDMLWKYHVKRYNETGDEKSLPFIQEKDILCLKSPRKMFSTKNSLYVSQGNHGIIKLDPKTEIIKKVYDAKKYTNPTGTITTVLSKCQLQGLVVLNQQIIACDVQNSRVLIVSMESGNVEKIWAQHVCDVVIDQHCRLLFLDGWLSKIHVVI